MAKIQDKLYNRIIEGELLELTEKEKVKLGIGLISQKQFDTNIGGNLVVDGDITVNDFTNISSKSGERHYALIYEGNNEDIEIIDAYGTYTFVKLLITDKGNNTLSVFEYAYNNSQWLVVATAGHTEAYSILDGGGILTIQSGYGKQIKVLAFIDEMITN